MHNNEKAVSVKVQHCEGKFYWDLSVKKKGRKFARFLQEVLGTNYPKVWRCQKSPGFVKSSDTLPVLFSGKWNCWDFFFLFSFVPQMAWTKKKEKETAFVSSLKGLDL